jgi:hypothetical protein
MYSKNVIWVSNNEPSYTRAHICAQLLKLLSILLLINLLVALDHLCGLVVRVPGYRSRGLGSITSGTRFSER